MAVPYGHKRSTVAGKTPVAGDFVKPGQILVNTADGRAFINATGGVKTLPNTDDLFLKPQFFGALGNGVADDGPAFNTMFDYIRANIAANGGAVTSYTVDLSGARWNIATSINATGIAAWNLLIQGGVLVGKCAGKPILDLVGSRGYQLRSIAFIGDKAQMPSCAYQLARRTAADFCDNQSFEDVSTTGYFSRAAIHCYGHETATHLHCTYFNYNHNAYVAIFEGYSGHPFTSDYASVMSGGTSFINNKLINCDFRYLPTGDNSAAITGVSKGASTIITAPGHNFQVGNVVTFADVGGLQNLQSYTATVTARTATAVTVNLNSSGMPGTFTGGGTLIRAQTKPTVYVARAEQFNFDCSYIVAYGQPHLELAFPQTGFARLEQLDLDLLFEGSGNDVNIIFSPQSVNTNVQGFRLKTYNSAARLGVMGIRTGTGTVTLFHPFIESVDELFSPNLVENASASRFAMFGADILFAHLSTTLHNNMNGFNGKVTELSNGRTHHLGEETRGQLVIEGSPVSMTAGSIGAYLVVKVDGVDYKVPLYVG